MAMERTCFPLKYQSFCTKCSEYLGVGDTVWGMKVDNKWIFHCYPSCKVIDGVEDDVNAHEEDPDYDRDDHNRVKSILYQYRDALFSEEEASMSSGSAESEYEGSDIIGGSDDEVEGESEEDGQQSGLYCEFCKAYRHVDDFSAQMKASMRHYAETVSEDDDSDDSRHRRKYFPPPYYCLRHTGTSGFNRPAKTKVYPRYEDSSASSDEEIAHNSPDRRKKKKKKAARAKHTGLTPATAQVSMSNTKKPMHGRRIILESDESDEEHKNDKKAEESDGEWDACVQTTQNNLLMGSTTNYSSSDGEWDVASAALRTHNGDKQAAQRRMRRVVIIDSDEEESSPLKKRHIEVEEEVEIKPRRAARRRNVIDD